MLPLSRRTHSPALQQSHLAPNAGLQIEWSGRPYPDEATGTVAIRDPAAVLAKLNHSMQWQGTPGCEPTALEFFIWVQRYLKNQVNDHLCQLEPMVKTMLERQAAMERLMEEVAAFMRMQICVLEAQVRSLVAEEELSPMDWEPTAPILAPAFQAAIDERIQAGIFNVLQRMPSASPPIPPSRVRQAPRQGLGTEVSQPAPPYAPHPPPPPPQEPPSSPPPPPVQNIFEMPIPQPRVVHLYQQALAGQAQVPAPPQVQAPVGDEQKQRELDEMRRRHDEEVQQLMARAALAAGGAGAGGGAGGGGGQQPPRVAGGGGGDPDPDSDADSDPEPDHGRHPRRWQARVRRRAEHQALRDAAQYFQGIMPQQQQVPADQRDCKVMNPEPFTGDPEDLERFLLQVDNKFEMEPNRFHDEVRKIRYAGQLLKDSVHKWYRAYHLQISERDATRVRGPIDLDPRYADWDRFEATLRATFDERVTREQATIEWEKLRHTTSIDDFVDEITRLMWITGYEGYTVEDKIRNGLNDVMVVEWAQVAQKPREVGEQLALLRDIGHSMEDALKQSSTRYKLRGGGSHKPNHSHDMEKGGKGGEKGKSKGKKGGQQKGKT